MVKPEYDALLSRDGTELRKGDLYTKKELAKYWIDKQAVVVIETSQRNIIFIDGRRKLKPGVKVSFR